MPVRLQRVCSSAWLERTPDKGEVGGSSPPRPTIFPFKINTLPLLEYTDFLQQEIFQKQQH